MNQILQMELYALDALGHRESELTEIQRKIELIRKEVELLSCNRFDLVEYSKPKYIATKIQKDPTDNSKKFADSHNELVKGQNVIQRLSKGLKSLDEMIRRLEEITRRSSFSNCLLPNEKDQRICLLEQDLEKERSLVETLQLCLKKEKDSARKDKASDTELIRQLKIELEDSMKTRNKLLVELKCLATVSAFKNGNLSEFKNKEGEQQMMDLKKELEAEKCKTKDCQEALKKLEIEKGRLEKKCKALKEDRKILASSLHDAVLKRDQIARDLQNTRAELKTSTRECDSQKLILEVTGDVENKPDQHMCNESWELQCLRKKLKNSYGLIGTYETETKILRQLLAESSIKKQLGVEVLGLIYKLFDGYK